MALRVHARRRRLSRANATARRGADIQSEYSGRVNRAQSDPTGSISASERAARVRAPVLRLVSNGLSVFDLLRYRRHDQSVTLCAFDILELDGTNFRPSPIEERKQHLASLLRFLPPGITLSPIYKDDGRTIYNHACALGSEGIVSKRLGSPYHSGRTDQWLKVKNPLAAARREREIDWAKR